MQDAGIKVAVQGEKEFKAAITNLNTATKTYKTELDALSSTFDKNASAMEKTKAKREALNTAIEKQKEKLENLKSALEQAENAENVNENTINKAKQAVANATIELSKMEAELQNLPNNWQLLGQSVQDAGDKITKVSESIQNVGDGMTKAITGPIAAVGTAAIASFKSLDTGYDTIVKKTGATGEAFADLKGQANDLYTSMNVSMDDIGTAIGEVNTRFGLTGDAVEAMSRRFLQFAQINGSDVNSSIDTVQNALAAFNLDASEAGNLLDVLTLTGQKTGASVDKMAQTVVSNATAFQEMGLDIYQAVDFMGKFETAGADAESVLSGLKRALKSATDEGIPLNDALANLEDTILNGTDGMDGLSAAYDLFGKSGAAVYQAVKNGQISFTEFADSALLLDEAIGSTANTYEATVDPLDRFQVALNSAKVTGADIGATILEIVTPAIEKLSEAVKKGMEWWEGLDDSQKKSIITIAGIVAAIGPAISIIGRLGTGIGTITKGIGKAITAFGGLSASTLATIGTIAAIVAVIAVLAAAFKNLWDNNEEFRTRMTEIWEGIKLKFEEFGAKVTEIVNSFGFEFGSVTEVLQAAWDGFCNLLAPVFEGAFQIVSTVLGTVLDVLSGLFAAFSAAFNGDWKGAWEAVKGVFESVWNGIATVFGTIWATIKKVAETAVNAVKDKLAAVWENIKAKATEIWNNIKDKISETWESIKTKITEAVNAVKEKLAEIWGNIKDKATEIWNSINEKISESWENIKTAVSEKIQAVKDKMSEVWGNIKDKVSEVWNNIKDTIQEKIQSAKDKVTEIVDGIRSGIEEKFNAAKGTVTDIFDSIKNKIEEKINGARDAVSTAIDKIKGLFNFEWSLPKLKLPHFSWTWSTLGDTGISLPHISVSWYKKAYDDPMLFTSPTVLATAAGLKGFGDGHGGEVVIGQNMMMDMISHAVRSCGGDDITINVYATPGMDENDLANKVATKLNSMLERRRAVYA